jgi:DNA-binding GntR family transcriptional regulator
MRTASARWYHAPVCDRSSAETCITGLSHFGIPDATFCRHPTSRIGFASTMASVPPLTRLEGLPVQRSLLRDQVRIVLIDQIVRGLIAPGDRLNEADLADQLQISRTPIKEAILTMERDGFVQASRGRGHVVTPLSRAEIQDTYPMLMAYEALILVRYPPDESHVGEMVAINAELADAVDVYRRLELDEAFHTAITGACTNHRLLRSIEVLELVTRRYSTRYPARAIDPDHSVGDHAAIIDALQTGETVGAVRALERHWNNALDRLLAAMEIDPPEHPGTARTTALGPWPHEP